VLPSDVQVTLSNIGGPPSVVGIRSAWTCHLCGKLQQTYQIVSLLNAELEPPPGWHVDEENHTICSAPHGQPQPHFAEGAD
jgi:hypothetical protein